MEEEEEVEEGVDITEIQKETPKNKVVDERIVPDSIVILESEMETVKTRLTGLP